MTAPAYGVVLMNMGGPWTLADIQPYLQRVLGDPHLVRLPGGWFYQGLFARLVSRRRARKVVDRYRQIGGGSPLLAETEALAFALGQELHVPVSIAMRYSTPFAIDAAQRLTEAGATRWIGVPLYPQYSTSTSASSLADFAQVVPTGIDYRVLERHFDNEGLVAALVEGIMLALQRADRPEQVAVLFTAHSIPVSYTAAGDPYVTEVEATAAAVAARLPDGVTTRVAFQSAVRFGTWHGPSVEELLPELREAGTEGLVVQPLTFVSENLETQYDLDIVLRQAAIKAGFSWYQRGPAPGPHKAYVKGLAAAIAHEATEEQVDYA